MVGLSKKRVFPKTKGDSITGQDRAQKHCDFRFSQIEKKSKVAVLQLIRRYTSPNENFEYGYPHSNALLQFRLKYERCKPHNDACHLMKCDVINDVKLFPAVYRRIYCRKFFDVNQSEVALQKQVH